jgi:hypothetical protein
MTGSALERSGGDGQGRAGAVCGERAGQDMQETHFPFYEEFVIACVYNQNAKFLDTYNLYIK